MLQQVAAQLDTQAAKHDALLAAVRAIPPAAPQPDVAPLLHAIRTQLTTHMEAQETYRVDSAAALQAVITASAPPANNCSRRQIDSRLEDQAARQDQGLAALREAAAAQPAVMQELFQQVTAQLEDQTQKQDQVLAAMNQAAAAEPAQTQSLLQQLGFHFQAQRARQDELLAAIRAIKPAGAQPMVAQPDLRPLLQQIQAQIQDQVQNQDVRHNQLLAALKEGSMSTGATAKPLPADQTSNPEPLLCEIMADYDARKSEKAAVRPINQDAIDTFAIRQAERRKFRERLTTTAIIGLFVIICATVLYLGLLAEFRGQATPEAHPAQPVAQNKISEPAGSTGTDEARSISNPNANPAKAPAAQPISDDRGALAPAPESGTPRTPGTPGIPTSSSTLSENPAGTPSLFGDVDRGTAQIEPQAASPPVTRDPHQLTKLQKAFKYAFETGWPVTIGGHVDQTTGQLIGGRVLDPVAWPGTSGR